MTSGFFVKESEGANIGANPWNRQGIALKKAHYFALIALLGMSAAITCYYMVFSRFKPILGLLVVCLLGICQPTFATQYCAGKLTLQPISDFVKENSIVDPIIASQISKEVHVFQFNKEDMGGAYLLRIMEQLGPKPSHKMDLIYSKYIKASFVKFLDLFTNFLKTSNGQKSLEFPAYFGLQETCAQDVQGGMIQWNPALAKKFVQQVSEAYNQTSNVNIVKANQFLVQMIYIYSRLSGNLGVSEEEARLASEGFTRVSRAGHIFLPTVGEWDIPNIVGQWFLNATVNMIPPELEGITDVHGGIASFAGIIHDHGHVFESCYDALSSILFGANANILPEAAVQKKIISVKKRLDNLIIDTLMQMRAQGLKGEQGQKIVNVMFFFIHEPLALTPVLLKIKSGEKDWQINSTNVRNLSRRLRETLEARQNFYPNLGTDFDAFERELALFLSYFGPIAKPEILFQ